MRLWNNSVLGPFYVQLQIPEFFQDSNDLRARIANQPLVKAPTHTNNEFVGGAINKQMSSIDAFHPLLSQPWSERINVQNENSSN